MLPPTRARIISLALGLCLLAPATSAPAAGSASQHARASHDRGRNPHGRRHAARHRHHGHRHLAHGSSTAGGRLFAPTSVWNQPIPRGAALDPHSATLVGALATEAALESGLGTGPWISTTSYSTPFYVVGPGQPTVKVALDDPAASWRRSLQAAFQAVPIPSGALPAVGSDAQMTVYQPSTDRLWEFWRMRQLAGGWQAAWGGAIAHVSQSPGYYDAHAWSGAAANWGASASSLPLIAGTMTVAELRAGTIDHALAIEVPFARGGVYATPAQRTDGRAASPTALPEGAHLQLDPALDVHALHLPPLTEQMALAAQRYGIVVRDESQHAIGFYGEDPALSGTNPYRTAGGFYGGRFPSDVLAHFPWGSLRVLRMDLRPAQR